MTTVDLQNCKHYRRIVDQKKFLNKLNKHNMEILYSETSDTFSPYLNDYKVNDLKKDPTLHRIIAKVN